MSRLPVNITLPPNTEASDLGRLVSAEARQAFEWLAGGSSSVQQQVVRDFGRAAAGFFKGTHRRPTWRRKHVHEGFCVRDTKVIVHNQQWAQVAVPKLGWVKFKLSRALPVGKLGMARITRDGAGAGM